MQSAVQIREFAFAMLQIVSVTLRRYVNRSPTAGYIAYYNMSSIYNRQSSRCCLGQKTHGTLSSWSSDRAQNYTKKSPTLFHLNLRSAQSWYSFLSETKLPLSGNRVLCRCLKTEKDYRHDCRQPVVIFAPAQKAFSHKTSAVMMQNCIVASLTVRMKSSTIILHICAVCLRCICC